MRTMRITSPRQWFNNQVEIYNGNHYAAMTLMMISQSCLGSIAAMYSLINDNITLLIVSTAVTMGANAVFIAQTEAKYCVGLFYLSLVVNSILILIGIS